MSRTDFGKLPSDRPGLPLTQYPTPNIDDSIIVHEFSRAVHQFEPLARGTPHPTRTEARLVVEKISKGDNDRLRVERIYATNRAAQSTYNGTKKFVAEGASYPIYVRSSIEPRPVTPATRNTALTRLIGLTLGAGGSGYTTAPAISFSGGSGGGAEAVAQLNESGSVVAVWLTEDGTGYTSAPTVTFAPGGNSASGTVVVDDSGAIASINVTGGGSGYTLGVTASASIGTGAVLDVVISGDVITAVSVISGGSGYTAGTVIAFGNVGAGSGATAEATIAYDLLSVTVDDEGSGYTSAPTVTISGDGSGATATATLTGHRVSGVTLTSPGSGYTSATASFSGGKLGSGATATALLQEISAVLTHEEITPAPGDLGSLFDQVVRVYSTQPGPVLHERTSAKAGFFWDDTRQPVTPGTLPSVPAGVTVRDSVQQTSTTEAVRTTRSLVKLDGTAAAGFPIYQTSRRDERTGVEIITDHFIAVEGYTLPATFVGGTAAAIAVGYPDWKQPATDKIGYGAVSYSPKRYVCGARKIASGEESSNVVVEIDHMPIPNTRVDDSKQIGFTFPAVFYFNPEPYEVPNDYAGSYRPPWPIGEDELAGFRKIAHRSGSWPVRIVRSYALGRQGNLPPTYRVITPGTASKFFRIEERTIHNAFSFFETLTDGSVQTTEDIDASYPSTYDSKDILVADAIERRLGESEIYETEITLISEDTPVREFPDPSTGGYSFGYNVFTITPAISFTASTATINGREQAVMNGRALVVSTTGGATATVTLFGRTSGSEGPVAVRESLSASGVAAATTNTFLSLREVMLNAPLSSGTVVVQYAVDPATAALEVTGTPANGYLIQLGLTAGTVLTYQLRTALTSDSITSYTVTNGGSGYAVAPLVTIASGAGTATASISGGAVVSLTVVNPGTGYSSGSPPSVSFSDGGTGAAATAVLTSSRVTSFTVGTAGTRYLTAPTVTIATVGTAATATGNLSGDAVGTITPVSGGSDYTSAPLVTITGGGGTGATAHAVLTAGVVTSVVVDAGGSGYGSAVTIVFTYGRGQGAQATASVSGGAVTGIVPKTATFTANASTNIITATAHGLVDGDGLTFSSSGTLPGGISAGTVYYVQRTTADTFKIATSIANLAASGTVDITTTGTGTHTMTYSGQGYLTAPTVGFSGGTGSGAAATAVVTQKRQIKVSSTKKTMAARIVQAINGKSLGANVGAGTTAHPDVSAKRSVGDLSTVEFSSTSPTSAPGSASWTFSVSSGAWNTLTAFTAGGDQDTLCTITAGVGQCFVRTILGGNTQLFDETNDNDKNATPNLPASPVLYTDWWAIPAGPQIKIKYSVAGAPAVRFAYQTRAFTNVTAAFTANATSDTFTSTAHGLTNGDTITVTNSGGALPAGLTASTTLYVISATTNTFQLSATLGGSAINITDTGTGTNQYYATASEPIATSVSVTVTNGLATISGTGLASYIGCKIVIPGDTTENELTSATTLIRAFAGSSGTFTAAITNLPATTMSNAVNGHPHVFALGAPNVTYIRLKITQLATPYKFRAARVIATWPIIP